MITRIRSAFSLLSVICWAASGPAFAVGADSPLLFVDVAAEAGLEAPTWCGREEKPHLLESGGTGLALFDYDVDGDLDLFLVNGWRLDGTEIVERGRNLLYRNDGNGVFLDVTERAGVGDDQWGTGVATGDVDGDRFPDLYVTNFGTDILYRNQGDGTYLAVAESPSVEGWSTGAVFFDTDADGDQDLFVAGYVDATLEEVLF
ncbi:MAG: VCBS repeat-containing protein, partial [Thermoanaerobaculia bacterium]